MTTPTPTPPAQPSTNHHHNSTTQPSNVPSLGTFDYVIIGAGPSAMGLLLGLLSPTTTTTTTTTKSTTRIALIERGYGDADPLTHGLHRWCAASHHPTCRSTVLYTARNALIPPPTTPTPTTTNNNSSNHQPHHYRLMDVPTGIGLGGSTLINAGLIIPPAASDFTQWPVDYYYHTSHTHNDTHNNDNTRGGVILRSVATIVRTMHENQCVKSSLSATATDPTVVEYPTMTGTIATPLPLVDNNDSDQPWMETTVPSCCQRVPCAVRNTTTRNSTTTSTSTTTTSTFATTNATAATTMQRASFYESLLEPLLRQDEDDSNNESDDDQCHDHTRVRDRLTIFTGYTAEKLLFTITSSSSSSTTTTTSTTTTIPSCTGVHVVNAITGVVHVVYGTRDIIVCTGAIASPVLLLASGIGRHAPRGGSGEEEEGVVTVDNKNNNNNKTLTSSHHPQPSDSSRSMFQSTAQAGVGNHLRDHVLLPRILLTQPYPIGGTRALNGVRAVASLILPAPSCSSNDTVDTTTTTTTTTGNTLSSSTQNVAGIVPDRVPITKAQISVMDSAAYTDLVPIMVATAVRFYLDPATVTTAWFQPLVPMWNACLAVVFHATKLLLHVLVAYTPVYFLLRYCITVMAVFLMNAESQGRVTVQRKKHVTGDVTGISDLDVTIDLGYLSCHSDVTRMMQAWQASDVAFPNVGIEVFPGPLVRRGHTLHAASFAMFARCMVRPYFHWMGTCAMRTIDSSDDDDDWVVDGDFCVRGVRALRVCDASVFPTLISAPTALTCAALGHVLASKLMATEAKT